MISENGSIPTLGKNVKNWRTQKIVRNTRATLGLKDTTMKKKKI